MKKNKLVFGFTSLSDSAFEIKAGTIITCMTGNAYFPNPVPNLDVVKLAFKNYTEGLSAAKSRDLVKVIKKKERRAELEVILTTLGHYVTLTANAGDPSEERSIMASSGFSLATLKSNPSQLGDTNNFAVKLGDNSGEVIVSASSIKKARSYTCLYSVAPVVNNAWMHALDTSPYFVITDLEPGKEYSFRIGVTGARGQVVYTEIITKMVV